MQLGKQIKLTLISVSSDTTSDTLLFVAYPCRTEISFRDYFRNALAQRRDAADTPVLNSMTNCPSEGAMIL